MRTRWLFVLLMATVSLQPLSASAGWLYAHGDSANTGFNRVDTLAAQRPRMTQPLGPMAPGANPVIGNDGMVYVGNINGELKAFYANGTPAWTRQLRSTHGAILASPVIGRDGYVYVVSTIEYTDHRANAVGHRFDSFLHKFTPGGGWLFAQQFPAHFESWPEYVNRGATNAAPNIWYKDGIEAVLVPAMYRGPYTDEVHLLAFSDTGALLADQPVTYRVAEVTGGNGLPDWFNVCYSLTWYIPVPGCLIAAHIVDGAGFSISGGMPFAEAGWPLPNVAIWQNSKGGTPSVMVADGMRDIVGYTFSPTTGFSEYLRKTDKNRHTESPPVVLPNGYTAFGDDLGTLSFIDANGVAVSAIKNLGEITAAPTRMNDGRLAVVSRPGYLAMVRSNHSVESFGKLNGYSIASAAASCTHLFVSTTEELVSYDATNMAPVAIVPWVGGGASAPVVGPYGHVYAIASNVLFTFYPPTGNTRFPGTVARTACDKPVFDRGFAIAP